MTEKNDFVGIVGALTIFVQNERVAAYNEAVDMMLEQTRAWMKQNGLQPCEGALPELLDAIDRQVAARHWQPSDF